jgi:RNA polymerase-binding protein DksA
MSAIDTESFRPLLAQERERIVSQIAHLHDDNSRSMEDELGELTRGLDNHLGDMATVTFDRELDEGLEEGAQQTLAQIDRAIAKLDDGTYGRCERCGKEIPEDRLRARPWAILCIDDQRLVDRG